MSIEWFGYNTNEKNWEEVVWNRSGEFNELWNQGITAVAVKIHLFC